MMKANLTIAACAVLLCAETVLATTAQDNCDSARVTAWKTYLSCVDGVVAQVAKGLPGQASRAARFDDYAAFATCRHAYFSQWSELQKMSSLAGSTCIGGRFADNGDGTVTDNLSALVWEKKTTDASVHDVGNRYTWSTGAPYEKNGTAFTDFLGAANGGGGCAGAKGWRVPTVAELQTILLDFACTGAGLGPTCSCPPVPCVDPALGSTQGPPNPAVYWSATSSPLPEFAWIVHFGGGQPYGHYGKTDGGYVRAVRGGL